VYVCRCRLIDFIRSGLLLGLLVLYLVLAFDFTLFTPISGSCPAILDYVIKIYDYLVGDYSLSSLLGLSTKGSDK